MPMVARGQACDQPTVKQHGDLITDLEQFFKLLGNHQHRRALAAQINQVLAQECGGGHVHSPGRLRHDQHGGLQAALAAHNEFLQIAAGEARGNRIRTRAFDAKAGDDAVREDLDLAVYRSDHCAPVRRDDR